MYKTELVYCACGCGRLRSRIDNLGRDKYGYIYHSKQKILNEVYN